MKRFFKRGLEICLCIMLLMIGVPMEIAHAQTTFEGGFDEEIITVYLGDITTVSGYVKCSGSKLARITYQIDGWSGTDDNNRYCTQEASGKTVYLEDMEELVLDTTTAPLNLVGTYVLTLVAKAKDGNWSQIDKATVQVEEKPIVDNVPPVYSEEWSDAPTTRGEISADRDVFDDDYGSQYVPENNPRPSAAPTQKPTHSETYAASVSSERWGEFYESSVELTIGEIARVDGYVSSSGSEIVQVTLQIDGWNGTDNNNRYCTQSTSGYNVSLADLSSLKLDTTVAPLNVPGTYTLHLVARTADGDYNKLDSMTIYVKNGEATETPQPAHAPTPIPSASETLPTALSSVYVVVSFESANVRANAGTDSALLGTVSAGTQLGYYDYSKRDDRNVEWYLVDYRGQQAWISSNVAEIVNITAQPAHSEDYAPENNSEPFADPTSQPAHEPEPTPTPGASESLPTVLSSQYAVETFTSARIRAKADKNSTSLGTVSAGTQLGYYDYSKRDDRNVVWYLVNYNGTQAWISSSVAEVVGKTSKSNAETKAVSISGSFGADNYVMKVGETLDIGISASAENANLDRVTINIDNYKNNEQYATRQISGSSWNGSLTLSSSSKPLNTPGTYTIKLFVKTDAYNADGTQIYKEVDQATLTVVGINGSFRQKTYTMFVGETLDIGISASAENANLDRVTINIDNYKNNEQYATRQISGPSWNGNLTLSSSSAPLNTPGTYTIKLFVKTDAYNANGEQIYKEVDQATLVVKEKTTNKSEQPTADSKTTETTSNAGNSNVSAEFTYRTKTIALGDTWPLDATIRAENTRIGEVRVSVLNTETFFADDFSGYTVIPYETNLKNFAAYIIDTNTYPFNRVGEYTLEISVKDADGYHSYDCLDEMTIKVVEKGTEISLETLKPLVRSGVTAYNNFGRYNDDKKRTHMGHDLGTSVGSAVIAARSGTVIAVDYEEGSAGYYVIIQDDEVPELQFNYFHLSDNGVVKKESHVKAGQLIGFSGNTGSSEGPHLDFRVKVSGKEYVYLNVNYDSTKEPFTKAAYRFTGGKNRNFATENGLIASVIAYNAGYKISYVETNRVAGSLNINCKVPVNLKSGSTKWNVRGLISSENPITYVKVAIQDVNGNDVVSPLERRPNVYMYDMLELDDLGFTSLGNIVGDYYYVITAKDSSGDTVTVNQKFTVSGDDMQEMMYKSN